MAAHLAHADVAVPKRDWTVGRVRFEPDALEAKDRRDDDRHRRTVQRPNVDSVEGVMTRVVFAWPPRSKFGLERVGDRRRQRHDRANIQVVIRPAVQTLADPWREGV